MHNFLDQKTIGKFYIKDNLYIGEINVNQDPQKLKIYIDDEFEIINNNSSFTIKGSLYDLTKITFIDAHYIGQGGYCHQKSAYEYEHSRYAEFSLHFVALGNKFIDDESKNILSLDFSTPNSNDLFYNHLFIYIPTIPESTVNTLSNKLSFYNYINSDTKLFIDNSGYEIYKFTIPYGKFIIHNNTISNFNSNYGFKVENIISGKIEFNKHQNF